MTQDPNAKARELLEQLLSDPTARDIESAKSGIVNAIAQALTEARRDALEEAAKVCMESAGAYRRLQERAREDKDSQGALAHLCEKEAALFLAKDIRALKEKA